MPSCPPQTLPGPHPPQCALHARLVSVGRVQQLHLVSLQVTKHGVVVRGERSAGTGEEGDWGVQRPR